MYVAVYFAGNGALTPLFAPSASAIDYEDYFIDDDGNAYGAFGGVIEATRVVNLTITNSKFDNSTALSSGGVLFCFDCSEFRLISSLFNNSDKALAAEPIVSGNGAALSLRGPVEVDSATINILIDGCLFQDFAAANQGGVLYVDPNSMPGVVELRNSVFNNNKVRIIIHQRA
jgi:hypothetical protein